MPESTRNPRKTRYLTYFRVAIFGLVLLAGGGVFLGVWYLKYLEGVVTAKFDGRKWNFPAKIFSDAYLIYPGMSLSMEGLETKLERLGYRTTVGRPRSAGEYRIQKKDGVMEVYLHNFLYPLGQFKGFPVRMTIVSNTATKLHNMDNGKEIFSLELEPEQVTGFYDRVWEERRLVTLAEVPPMLVRAILAIEDERFYHHMGIDPIAVMRAFIVNLTSRGIVQGGSTLTQQLMKNFFLGSERTTKFLLRVAASTLRWGE